MKRILVALLVLAALAVPAVAQMGDARAYGLAQAMTAVGDDANALVYNPAGLAFVRHGYLNVDANARIGMSSATVSGTDEWGYPYSYETMVPTWMTLNPRVLLGGRHWAATAYQSYYIENQDPNGTLVGDSIPVYVESTTGYAAGLGFALGPIAIGANARYATARYYYSTLSSGDQSAMMDLLNPAEYYEYDPSLKVGLGAILTLGSINLGLYNANVMPFLDKGYNGDFGTDFLNTMNLGLSWMPSDNKFSDTKFPLVLMASLDLRNFGDETNRVLAMGGEIGLDAGNFLVALARAGYSQGLPGPIDSMFDNIDPSAGRIYVGATGKFWFAKVDISASFPTAFMFSEDEAVRSNGPQSMTMAVTASLAF